MEISLDIVQLRLNFKYLRKHHPFSDMKGKSSNLKDYAKSINMLFDNWSVSPSTISTYETNINDQHYPPVQYLVAVSKYENIPLDVLLYKNIEYLVGLNGDTSELTANHSNYYDSQGYISNAFSSEYNMYFHNMENTSNYFVYFYSTSKKGSNIIEGKIKLNRDAENQYITTNLSYDDGKLCKYKGFFKISKTQLCSFDLFGDSENVHMSFSHTRPNYQVQSQVGLVLSATSRQHLKRPISQKFLLSKKQIDITKYKKELKAHLNKAYENIFLDEKNLSNILDKFNINTDDFYNKCCVRSESKLVPIKENLLYDLYQLDDFEMHISLGIKPEILPSLITELRVLSMNNKTTRIEDYHVEDFYLFVKSISSV